MIGRERQPQADVPWSDCNVTVLRHGGARMIDQVTHRRITRSGVTAFDRKRSCPGYVLYCPSHWEPGICLIDLSGQVVHRWETPYCPRHWGYLLSNGNLFFLGKLSDQPHGLPIWPIAIGDLDDPGSNGVI